jgi:histidine triad (HIT) family protein
MSDCLFCNILSKKIETIPVFENDSVYAFKDIHPQAKEHYLFIHKRHTANINELVDTDPEQLKDLFIGISEFTKENGLDKTGFRVVTNYGEDGGQTVFHTHLHVLAGEQLKGFGA